MVSMRAMMLEQHAPAEKDPLRLVEIPLPEPGTGEVRIRIQACGLCRTDLHIAEGDLKLRKSPVIPGHQIVGIVDTVGKGAKAIREGDRVGVAWVYSTCGECTFCRRNLENLCDRGRFTGWDTDG